MRGKIGSGRLLVAAFVVLLVLPARAAELNQPDCAQLEGWTAGHDPKATFTVLPGVEISTLFRDETVVPLFGREVLAWANSDFSAVQGWLNDCRQAALKRRDKTTGNSLYQASKTVRNAGRVMFRVASARANIERRVQTLIDQRQSPELPEILALAQDALRGQDIMPRVRALHPRNQGLGMQAAELKQASEVMPESAVAALIDKLEARRGGATQAASAHQEELREIGGRIAAIPLTRAGLTQLNRLAQTTATTNMSRQELTAYNTAIQNKRNAINRNIQQMEAQAQQARATQPAPVAEQLDKVLNGSSVDELTLRGLQPGMPYAQAKAKAESEWGFSSGAGGDVLKQFTLRRRDLNRTFKTEGRAGGALIFETMFGKLGKVTFMEHFTGPMNVRALHDALVERFGKPDGDANVMTWSEGKTHLQITANDRIADISLRRMGYRSSVVVALWSQDYTVYLEEAKRRCAELRDKPTGELSMNDKKALLMGCKTP